MLSLAADVFIGRFIGEVMTGVVPTINLPILPQK
jgi:hypothetical protein